MTEDIDPRYAEAQAHLDRNRPTSTAAPQQMGEVVNLQAYLAARVSQLDTSEGDAQDATEKARKARRRAAEAEAPRRAVEALLRTWPLRDGDLEMIIEKRCRSTLALDAALGLVRGEGELKHCTAVVMCGGLGTGKTLSTAAAVWDLGKRRGWKLAARTERVTASELRWLASAPPFADGLPRHQRYQRLLRAPLLVVEELGTERPADRDEVRRALYEIADKRQTRSRLTFYLTNQTWKPSKSMRSFEQVHAGSRFLSRIIGCGRIVGVGAESLREKR